MVPEEHRGPLSDLLVVDISRVLTGPYAAMMLGDLGARVIKVERPGVGDETRHWGPPFVGYGAEETSTYFLSINRNKESITLDFKDDNDISTLKELIRRADVLIENFRAGVTTRLGLGTDVLRALNPRLVILSITGFGHDGPDAGRVGYDQIAQAETGIMSMTGPVESQPTKVGVPIADLMAGMFGAYGVLAALHRRERTGDGDVVRTSLAAAAIAAHSFQGTRWLMAGEVPLANGNAHPTLVPYQTLSCEDGLIQIAVGNDHAWQRCAKALGMDPDDARYRTNADRVASRERLIAEIEATTQRRPVAEWLKVFADCGVPAGQVKTLEEVYADPQLLSQGAIKESRHDVLGVIRTPGQPLRFDDAELAADRPPPLLNEHGVALRTWLNGKETEE